MKRVDLFINEREIDRICKAIRKAGVPGYSVTRHVTGMGPGGGEISEAMDFSSFGANALVVVFCEPGLLEALRRELRPLLSRFGGVGFLSEAERL
jgi:nitrogen regulatory protein PII